jgi:hypothetical protein
MKMRALPILATLLLCAHAAKAAPAKGDIVQTDTLGMNVVSYDYSSATVKTIADRAEPSEFIGLHYFFADGWRVGLNLQFTERLAPALPSGQSAFRTFAVLPQVGWHFCDPFFVALVLTLAPYIDGESLFTLGTQVVFGAGFSLTDRVKLNLALEVPVNFVGKMTVGLTPLVGVSIRL